MDSFKEVLKKELKEDRKLTYAVLLDGTRAMESAHRKFPEAVPIGNIIQMRKDAKTYKSRFNL